MFLATLATVNFSLSFYIGLLSSPLSFIGLSPAPASPSAKSASTGSSPKRIVDNVVLHALAPPVVAFGICWAVGVSVETVLMEAAFGWRVWGLWTQVIVWCVWWPAWLAGAVGVSPGF